MRFQMIAISVLALAATAACKHRSFNAVKSQQDDGASKRELRLGALDPMLQLVEFENHYNVEKFATASYELSIPAAAVDKSLVSSKFFGRSGRIEALLGLPGSKFRWFKHPLNKDRTVPFFGENNTPELEIKGYYSSSRSLFFRVPGEGGSGQGWYSLKLPTSFIRPTVYQPKKAKNAEELGETDLVTNHALKIRPSPFETRTDLLYLHEVAFSYTKTTQGEIDNGFFIRDLSPLASTGNYYLPAFSSEFAGEAIYKACKGTKPTQEEFDNFWRVAFAENIGKAKANLLVEFGIYMWTPNAQNWLIELDNTKFCPTGRIVVRDIVDSRPVESVMAALGHADYNLKWKDLGRKSADVEHGGDFWSNDAKGPENKWSNSSLGLHLGNHWNTIWQTRWQYDATFLEAEMNAFFNTLKERTGQLEGERWKEINGRLGGLQSTAVSLAGRYITLRKAASERAAGTTSQAPTSATPSGASTTTGGSKQSVPVDDDARPSPADNRN